MINMKELHFLKNWQTKCNPIQLVANILNNAAWLITNGASDIE